MEQINILLISVVSTTLNAEVSDKLLI